MNQGLKTIGLSFVIGHLSFGAVGAQTLQELYDMADRQSLQILVSQTGLRAASEAVAAAKGAMLPNVSLGATGSYIGDATLMSRGFSTSGTTDVILAGLGPQQVRNGRQTTPHWGNTFTAQASQVIYAGGAIQAGIRMAELGEEMARLDIEKQRQEVRFLITGYYLDLCKLQNQTAVVDQNIALTEKVIHDMEARRSQGTVLKNDITRYELQLKTLHLAREKLLDATSIIHHQLCTTLHVDSLRLVVDSLGISPSPSDLSPLEKGQDGLPATLRAQLDNNVGIRQASVASQLAEQKVRATQAASRPSLAVIVEDNLFGPYTNDLVPVDANINAWFVGIGLKYDLGSLWKNKHNLRRARLGHRQSQQQVALAREGVENGLQACYVNYLTAFNEVETQQKQVELATQNYAVVQNRYRNDLALLTDMLDASSTKLAAEMALADARIALLYSYYRLRYMTSSL